MFSFFTTNKENPCSLNQRISRELSWSVGRFGISRTALREAVKLLTSKKLLESRPKIGTRVVDRAYWNFLHSQLIEWMDGLTDIYQFCHQFLGLRRAIEPEACALASKFASVEQYVEL